MKMTKYKLGELVEVTRGASLSGQFYAEEGKLIRLTLGNFNMNGGGFKENTSKTDLYFTGTVRDEFILNKGDIITPLTEQSLGLLGTTARIPESGKYIQSQDVALVRCKEGLLVPNFCYYLISSSIVRQQLSAAAQQTKIRHTSPEKIKDCTVWVPDFEVQKNIGRILTDIDNKIAINRRINDNLEAMAKQLYDYWFVQFDFPNEEGKPYKSSGGAMAWNERLKREIPIGWTCCSIKEMCDINKKTINKDEHKQIEYLDTGSITQGHISNTEIYSVDMAPSRAQRKVEDLSILYSSVRPRLLHYGILSTPNENFIVSTGFVTLDAKCKKMALMVYYFLTSNTITEHLASIADTAVSSYPSISPDDIAYLDIVIPSNDIIQKYNDIVEPMFRKMSTLRKEIDSLTKQRDELLPLLMNGQASVNYHLSVHFFFPLYYIETNTILWHERNNYTSRFRRYASGSD